MGEVLYCAPLNEFFIFCGDCELDLDSNKLVIHLYCDNGFKTKLKIHPSDLTHIGYL